MNDQANTPTIEAASGPIYKVAGRPMTEAQIGEAMRALAREEGHMPGLPKSLEESHGGDRSRTLKCAPEILAFLSATPGRWYRTRQIADALGMPLTSVNSALGRMLRDRLVAKRKGVPAYNPGGFVVEWAAK